MLMASGMGRLQPRASVLHLVHVGLYRVIQVVYSLSLPLRLPFCLSPFCSLCSPHARPPLSNHFPDCPKLVYSSSTPNLHQMSGGSRKILEIRLVAKLSGNQRELLVAG